MLRIASVPVLLIVVYALLTTTTACSKAGDVNPTDSIPVIDPPHSKPDTLLASISVNGKIYKKIEYDSLKHIRSVYTYSLVSDDTITVTPEDRSDYQYNNQGQVSAVRMFRSGQLAGEATVTYLADTMYYSTNGAIHKYNIIRPGKITRTGDMDTIVNHSNGVSVINFALYTMQGSDLVEFYSADYYRNNDVYQWDLSYGEQYTYDSTLNPLWPMVGLSPYFAWEFLQEDNIERNPFAFTLSKHNPLQVDLIRTTRRFFPPSIAFQYKLFPGTSYPKEQKWIDRSNGSVYATYTYDYVKVP